jgi:hypothetical protein
MQRAAKTPSMKEKQMETLAAVAMSALFSIGLDTGKVV